MRTTSTGIAECYGTFSAKREDCHTCQLRSHCRTATADDVAGYLERSSAEFRVAQEEFASLPVVYDENNEAPPELLEHLKTYDRVKRFLVFLVSLHPVTLAALKKKFTDPDYSKDQIAAALGINTRYMANKICAVPAVASVFHRRRQRGSDVVKIHEADHVYISGPMSGMENLNRDAFLEAEETIRERYRCNVVNPVYLEHLMGDGRDQEHYLHVDLALVRTSSVLVLLPGWEASTGAQSERAAAVNEGLRIYRLDQVVRG